MVKNIKIKHFLILSFALILLFMNILGGMSIFYMQRLAGQNIEFYENTHTVQIQIESIELIMSEISNKIRDAVIYKTDDHTRESTAYIESSLKDMESRITTVKELFKGNRSLLDNADSAVTTWLSETDKLKELLENDRFEAALNVFETDYLSAETTITAAVEQIKEETQSTALGYYESARRSKVISLYVILSMLAVTIGLPYLLCRILLKSIAYPLALIKDAAFAMSEGNLHQEIDFEGKNEFGQLASVLRKTSSTLSAYVKDIDRILASLSDQDLTVELRLEYVGDFQEIMESLKMIIHSYREMVGQIEASADQVEAGSQELSASSQVLSQGASEQAASVQELTASLNEISAKLKENSENTDAANELTASVEKQLETGNGQMQEMLDAMSAINASSNQIAKIIKTIEDIAFQTNILALNAAVEAARAGSAGKGFAVVADEVRNLAGKSAEAAKSTAELIQNSITAVGNGASIADSTARTLQEIVSGAGDITRMVSKIAINLQRQSDAVSQITVGINQLNDVIQTNSATSEESASASEELNSQAMSLKALIDRFRL